MTADHATLQRLERFLDLLTVWSRTTRLTGERDIDAIVCKHVVDSMAAAPFLPQHGRLLDVGTGGGFPGVVLACFRPDLTTLLVESRRRRASFLREVTRVVPLESTIVLEARVQEAPRRDATLQAGVEVVTARAVRLDAFLSAAAPLLAPGGQAIAMQTPGVGREVAAGAAASVGLSLAGMEDYELPGGERRRLLRFGRR